MATKKVSASARLFSGVYPTGIVYADKLRERSGDYMRVAFLPFDTLELEWAPGTHPPGLRKLIKADAAAIIARRGQAYPVSASGQTVTLGFGGPKRDYSTRKKQTSSKQSAEYVRGFDFGAAAARDVSSRHGKNLAEFNARDLERSARQRGAGAFDKGYAAGYRSFVGNRR